MTNFLLSTERAAIYDLRRPHTEAQRTRRTRRKKGEGRGNLGILNSLYFSVNRKLGVIRKIF